MELKSNKRGNIRIQEYAFNRTAYGIEIQLATLNVNWINELLIAPLMELK